MPWRVDLARRAERDLDRLSVEDRDAVLAALERLGDDPSSVDYRKLAGSSSGWHLPVGRWRVLIEADNRAGVLTATRVLDRRDAYRD
jgi:mRNA-degrading endonuclease RelE of RelBE toxin-antitoxin system